MSVKELHAEYVESCELFGVEHTHEGFVDYVAKVRAKGTPSEPKGIEETPLAFLDKGKKRAKEDDEDDEEGGGEGSKKRRKGARSAFEAQLIKACHEEFELRVKDGRLEPLLHVPKQESAVSKYVTAVQNRCKWATAPTNSFVRAKARSIVNNNRYLWKCGRWATDTKTGMCTWVDPQKLHPYTTCMEEGVPTTCPVRQIAKKMEVLKALPEFELEEGPNSKVECLQGEARQRLVAYLYDHNAPDKDDEEEADRLEADAKKKEVEAKAKKAPASASASAKGKAKASEGPASASAKGKAKAAASPAPSPAKPAKLAKPEAPNVEDIFKVGKEVVVYAGAQTEYEAMKSSLRPDKGGLVTNTGRLKANVGLFAGLVVANAVGDILPNHIMDGPDFPLTEGLIGIKVTDILDMKMLCKEKPYAYVRSAISYIMKEVDKRLPEGMDASHRVGNPGSEASLLLQKAFMREGRTKIKTL
ncbi:hypothetical protein CYMTET_20981 [Cymbomonas tetramitiformis]|uniref:Uncharacterized protein n=1 Tax=Cymbomonas tetramitiformis TaxID=36881 RepID=A0AAE0C3X2_9CHLO|nr:hypothetical protein CYMTET_43526 [Cymbomonas tetramitiformis]KAK3270627.1 hypothetical protein CYMTET_20981 [Cymbomonas tetramitiformis]